MSAKQASRGAAALALACALCACNDGAKQARARHDAAQQPAPVVQRAAPGAPDTLDMVSAVSSAGTTTPINLKFSVPEAPRVGKPVQLTLALIQADKLPIQDMHLSIQAREGLQLSSPSVLDFFNPEQGATQLIPVAVVPQQPGLLSLAVTVLVNSELDSLARTYTVPLIALAAEAPPAPSPGAPATGAAAPVAQR